jgi:hypothetical protein
MLTLVKKAKIKGIVRRGPTGWWYQSIGLALRVLSSEVYQLKVVSSCRSLSNGEVGRFSANFARPHPLRAL